MAPKRYPNLDYEIPFWRDGYVCVAGLDEAGRGAWAGPVVAGAVILPALDAHTARGWRRARVLRAIARVNDSKQLSPLQRQALVEPIRACAIASATGAASHREIDEIGIAPASKLAMRRALEALAKQPEALLLDALVLPEIELPQVGLIHGDAISLSIAAASILAKVTRDRLMCELDAQYPAYHFARHKGYGTADHRAALAAHGPSPVHRRSYAPIRAVEVKG
ncbi:MAG: ribonuclease HII [Anaerolineae bacterium]